jgi:thiosulfate dehydrogenase [quinone] large subunit
MNEATVLSGERASFRWNRSSFRTAPGRMTGITLVLVLRYLFGFFFLGAGINKLAGAWLWSDRLRQIFTERLAELEPGSAASRFLENVGIPLYVPIAWVVTVVEFVVPVCLFLGLATRTGGLLAVWLMAMFAIGGYYDASLIPLWLIAGLFVVLPTGHWLGLDRRLHQKHPHSIWFK